MLDQAAPAPAPAAPAPTTPTGAAPAHGWIRRHWIKVASSVVIAAAFGWTLHRGGLPLIPSREALRRVSVASCLLYVLLMVMMHWFRATRWRHLLAPVAHVPFRRML